MRQAGIIAAAGIIAVEKMVDRLRDDHSNAQMLGKGLASIQGISLAPSKIQTNMVICDVSGLGITGDQWVTNLGESGVKAGALEGSRVRLVTHRGIEKDDIDYTISVAEKAAKKLKKK